jgi:glycosyltransferase involved in cell wall biosynthesis
MMADVRRSIVFEKAKARVIPFGVPLDRFRGDLGSTGENSDEAWSNRFRVLLVSEYGEHKGLGTLLKAFVILQSRGERDMALATTACPDDFPESEIVTRRHDRELARHPALSGVVRFLGHVPYERVAQLYNTCDLFVFPSLAESFGHPLVEAMASGVPVVASDIPICREICGDAAVFFRAGDAEDLVDKITELRRDPARRVKLGEYGRRRVTTYFSWKEHVRQLIMVLEELAA